MHDILESIFVTKKFVNSKGQTIEIHSETSKGQCAFLQDIIRRNKFKKSIEIGFAYGTSTISILEEVAKNGGSHTAIDPIENELWGGNGLDLVGQAGYADKLEFIEEFCYVALPKLLQNGRKFDFAYLDTVKEFDWLLVDFFYLDRMLNVGGIIVFDDVNYPGIAKLLRFLSQLPHYKVYDTYQKNYEPTWFQKARLKLLRLIPYSDRIFKEEIMKSNSELGINTRCAALIKMEDDKRNWDWNVSF